MHRKGGVPDMLATRPPRGLRSEVG